MGKWMVLLLMAGLAVSGCVGDDEGETDDEDLGEESARAPTTPEPITEGGSFVVGADPFNFAMMEPCSQAVSSCDIHPFTLNTTATVDAVLSWGIPANDFDLYIYTAAGELVTNAGINAAPAPETQQVMPSIPLTPGDYEFYVVAWLVVADDYTLEATFTVDGPAAGGNSTAAA